MAAHEQILERLLASKNAAAACLQCVKSTPALDYEFFRDCLRGYILEKYLLNEEEAAACATFDELVTLSIGKSMSLSGELVAELETAQNCGGATSSVVKKVLLLMAIQKDLSIELPEQRTAYIVTLDDLIGVVWETMKASPAWTGRIKE